MFYHAVKIFKTFNEAVSEVMKSSYSLSHSDLGLIKAEDFSEVQDSIDRYHEMYYEPSYGEPCVYFGKSHYSEMLTENFNLAEESDEEKEDGFFNFYYCTSSGINDVMIRELRSGEEIIGYETVYGVMSDKPLEYSTAMNEFRKNGWQCCERAYELSPEEEVSLREEYENQLIDNIFESRQLPDLYFYVGYGSSTPDSIPYIASHCMSNNPNTIEVLLKNHSELSDEVVKIIDEQVAEMDAIEVPTTYDFNDTLYIDSDFYIKKREEIRKTLLDIKEAILTKKTREEISGKDELLSSLEDEERWINEAEEMIEKLENSSRDVRQGKSVRSIRKRGEKDFSK